MFNPTEFIKAVGEANARLVLNTTLKNIDKLVSREETAVIQSEQIKAYKLYFETIDALNKGIAAGVSQSKDSNQPDFEAADDWNNKRDKK